MHFALINLAHMLAEAVRIDRFQGMQTRVFRFLFPNHHRPVSQYG